MKKSVSIVNKIVPSSAHYYLMTLIEYYHLTPQIISQKTCIPFLTISRLLGEPDYEVSFRTFERLLVLYASMLVSSYGSESTLKSNNH